MRLFFTIVFLASTVSADAGGFGRRRSSCANGQCGMPQQYIQYGHPVQAPPITPQAPPITALPAPVPPQAPSTESKPVQTAQAPVQAPVAAVTGAMIVTNQPVGALPAPVPGVTLVQAQVVTATWQGSDDALDEVNTKRQQRGLRLLAKCPLLTQAAAACSKFRAARRIEGHVGGGGGDFTFIPAGGQASSAGCAAMEDSWGWQSCCWDEPQYTVAGAAWARGPDGQRYMHIFVR